MPQLVGAYRQDQFLAGGKMKVIAEARAAVPEKPRGRNPTKPVDAWQLPRAATTVPDNDLGGGGL